MEQNILEQILEGRMKPTHLPLETLRKITHEFSMDRKIGEGGFGTVYKGVIGNRNVAVKRIMSSMTVNQKLFLREVDSQMDVSHENVVRFLGLCSHTVETPVRNPESRGYILAEIRERLLCFEYVSNGSLDKYITDELRGLEWDIRYQIIKGICAGLYYLHVEKRILHMDLKPANILLDNQMVPKITDFGLSRPVENPQTMTSNHFSSPGYGAPENLFGHGTMSVQSDMYSLGVIIVELVTGERKGIPDNKNNILRRWRHRWNKSAKETPPEYHQQVTECIEIGSLCMNFDAYARPSSMSEIMRKFVEMENTKINPIYWDDDMLGVEPLELQFEYNEQHQISSCSVELINDTDGSIAFKIQSTSPLPYVIKPNKDIVKPHSKCSVVITLPVASTRDHKTTLQYGTSNTQCSQEFIVRSIKVNEGLTTKDINQDMFDKHTEGHHVDEILLTVVSAEPCSEEVATAGKKMMLELTGADYTSDRPGLDLVLVVDLSGRMAGKKMDMLKAAMRFVALKLTPIDRLSIVTFSSAATRCCPLLQITEASQNVLYGLIGGLMSSGGTNIMDGLQTGLKILADRKFSSGRVVGIMLMSDGHQSRGDATRVTVGNVPVYTFGFGPDCDPRVLSAVAANSMGGTFSHVQEQDIGGGGLTMAFAQCLAGLVSVVVHDLELTFTAIGEESTIVKVTAGSYPQMKEQATGSVTVRFGDLYTKEVRKVIVDLLHPIVQAGRDGINEILKVTYSYDRRYIYQRDEDTSSSGGRLQQSVAPPDMLAVRVFEEAENPPELQMEETRLQMANMVEEARTMADCQNMEDARNTIVDAQNMLMVEQFSSMPLLMAELQELSGLLENANTYEDHGRSYALALESSHDRQRFAARGNMEIMRLFATPRMDMYLAQAKMFQDDHTMPLPSADYDAEEFRPPMINIASRKEQMRILSEQMED